MGCKNLSFPISLVYEGGRGEKNMKINIEFETNKDLDSQIQEIKGFFNDKNSQQKINNSNDPKKVLCMKCNADLYTKYDNDTVKKIINYCNIKYNKKVYCKDCQQKLEGGDA